MRRTLERERRSAAVDPLVIDAPTGFPGADPAQSGAGTDIPPAAVVAAMTMLPARHRAMVALRHALDLDVRQIAAVMGGRATRIAARLDDAHSRLVHALEGHGPVGEIEEISDVG